MAERMADAVIGRALPQVQEIWGMEIMLRMPELYAGTTDLVGVFGKREAIMDYKSTRANLKSREQIHDYFDQLAAYALAHNAVFGTNIKVGVIFMVTRDCAFRQFVLEGLEFERHQVSFLSRLERYMDQQETLLREAAFV
jgi:genome maintenance exonuclease 1